MLFRRTGIKKGRDAGNCISIVLLATIVMCAGSVSNAIAEIFSWTDSTGTMHIANDISKVPPEYQDQAKSRQLPDEDETDTAPQGSAAKRAASSAYGKKAEKRARTGTENTDKYGRGEDYWRERADELRQQLSELKDEYAATDRQEQECERKPFDYHGKRPDCSFYRSEKAQLQRSIERTQKALDVDLPDEARKAEAYPGWLR